MIDARKVFDWMSPENDPEKTALFANDLAELIEQIAESVQTSVTVQTHSEEYARNRAVEKIREHAEQVRAFRID